MPNDQSFDANEHLNRALSAIDAQIAELQSKRAQLSAIIGGKPAKASKPARATKASKATAPAKPKRVLSAAAIERIRAAQKKRWAEARKNKK